MLQRKELMVYNILLLIIAILMSANSIMLECLHGEELWGVSNYAWQWIHCILGFGMLALIIVHLYYNWHKIQLWYRKLRSGNSVVTKILTWLSLITFLLGIAAFIVFLCGVEHNMVGKIHGKFGLVLIVLMIMHIIKRAKWFKKETFSPVIDESLCCRCGKCVKSCPVTVYERIEKSVMEIGRASGRERVSSPV